MISLDKLVQRTAWKTALQLHTVVFKDCLCEINKKKKAISLQGMKNVLDLSVRGVEGEVSVFILASLTRINLCAGSAVVYFCSWKLQLCILLNLFVKHDVCPKVTQGPFYLLFYSAFFSVRNRHFWLTGWLFTRMQRVAAGVQSTHQQGQFSCLLITRKSNHYWKRVVCCFVKEVTPIFVILLARYFLDERCLIPVSTVCFCKASTHSNSYINIGSVHITRTWTDVVMLDGWGDGGSWETTVREDVSVFGSMKLLDNLPTLHPDRD